MTDELKHAALVYAEAVLAFATAEKYGAECHKLIEARDYMVETHDQMYQLAQAEAL